ncbi:MAG: CDP-glucose 4,6-dehydratase [Allosphingosinicella sp.]
MNPDIAFWRDRPVLLTGHTGFKGAWAAVWLARLGARVTGLSLAPETQPSLWSETGSGLIDSAIIGDIREPATIRDVVASARPSVVLHMAAQSLVRRSYAEPAETFETNLMGTVNLLDALRSSDSLDAILVVTTDKVYANNDQGRDFIEDDPLGGHDPYSASKAAAEIATASYGASFFEPRGIPVATSRAGNVIGGGDWAADRLIPDVWRAAAGGEPVALRHPDSTRPWQHVLEPLAGYFLYLEALAGRRKVPAALNFGPPAGAAATVASVAEAMAQAIGAPAGWRRDEAPAPPEMKYLSLDPSLAIETLGWRPRLSCDEAIQWSARWYADHDKGADPLRLCQAQLEAYEALA